MQRSIIPMLSVALGAGCSLLALLGLVGFFHGPVSDDKFGSIIFTIALGFFGVGIVYVAKDRLPEGTLPNMWFPRRIMMVGITAILAPLFGWLWLWGDTHGTEIRAAGLFLMISAMASVYSTGKLLANQIDITNPSSAPARGLVVLAVLFLALSSGSIVLATIAHLLGRGQDIQLIICTLVLMGSVMIKARYWRHLKAALPAQPSSDKQQMRVLMLLGGVGILILFIHQVSQDIILQAILLIPGAICVLAAVWLERALFFHEVMDLGAASHESQNNQ